ncbi:hypothetical protein GCM10007301_52840 [Azorhizobium oxalatiphilum]|uniref:Secreted protein n=1 Tax=Azorhizobium oxalatiphilum TaxID=980631 RepID=A0A917CI07_9HYPH|nr:hypothetical protein [Azorhizobium oxalatiphilum]GGF86417.1 hypothetical protein GCM10007301_52840 [Azorhizobium oxalatiphilum]
MRHAQRIALRGVLLLLGALAAPISTYAQTAVPRPSDAAQPFDAARAFCERQTFALETMAEVDPWLAYFSGLRTGRTPAPDDDCPSRTVHTIISIVGSGSVEAAEASRAAFHGFYVTRAMEPQSAERRLDTDTSFRYRNDLVLAGFVWMLCPGRGPQQVACVKRVIEGFPARFLQTSPVFCDFAPGQPTQVEWPASPQTRPLTCAKGGNATAADAEAWLKQAANVLAD